jgi:hypothetical protein
VILVLALLSAAHAQGPVVALSGTVDSQQAGPVRLELLKPQGPGKNPLLVWHAWVNKAGPFSLELPAGLGEVKLRAAIDVKRDGIGPDDPQIRIPLSLVVGQSDIANITLAIRSPEHGSPALPGPVVAPKPISNQGARE